MEVDKAVGRLPPIQGSVKEKLKFWYPLPACARNDKDCPSPIGTGLHASCLNRFLTEKLPKVSPKVPKNVPAPYPPCNSIWLELLCTNSQFKSTVLVSGLGLISGLIWVGSKYPKPANSYKVLLISVLENKSPGFVLNSRAITWS